MPIKFILVFITSFGGVQKPMYLGEFPTEYACQVARGNFADAMQRQEGKELDEYWAIPQYIDVDNYVCVTVPNQ